ncbi:MAG: PAS domain-containing protein [Chloroflexi bacterium]|nr:PAS domain-containing protein [Chloroflexota bacterium]
MFDPTDFADLADAIDDLILAVDPDALRIDYANRAVSRVLGCEPDAIAGLPLPDLLAADSRAALRAYLEHAWEPDGGRLDVNLRHRSGTSIPVEMRINTGHLAGRRALVCVARERCSPLAPDGVKPDVFHDLLFQTLPFGIVIFDTQGRLQHANPAARAMACLGLDSALEGGQKSSLFDDNPAIRQCGLIDLLRGVLAGHPFQTSVANLTMSGHIAADLYLHGAPVLDEANRVVGGLLLVDDRTEQMRAEARLLNSEAKYRALLNAVPDLLFRISREGVYLDYKPGDCTSPYLPPEQFLGRKMDEVRVDGLDAPLLPLIERVLDTGEMATFEYQLEEPDGPHHYEARMMASVPDEVLLIVRDVTEQKRVLQALRASEQRYRGLIESQQDMIVRVDPQNRFTFINDAYCQKFGKPREELLGQTFTDLVHPDDLPHTLEALVRLEHPPYRVQIEERALTVEGWRWIGWEDTAIHDEQGRLVEIQAIGRDITTRKEAQAILEHQAHLMSVIAAATNHLLAPGDFDTAIQSALAMLGKATGVDRVYVFENYAHPKTGEVLSSQRYEWTGGNTSPQIDNPLFQDASWRALGVEHWYRRLAAGEVISAPVRDLPPSERVLFTAQDVQSMLVVPIVSGGDFWGFIGLDDCHTERNWTERETSALQTMAASIGAVIERQRVEDTLRHERELAETLRDTGTVLSDTLDQREVLERLLEQVRRVIPYDAANVMLIEKGNVARIVQTSGYDTVHTPLDNLWEVTFPLDEAPLYRHIVITQRPYACEDTTAEQRWIHKPVSDWVRSWLGAPIVSHGQVVGFFSLDSAQPGFYTREHARLIEPFAEQAAIAFKNAQLYQQVQDQTRDKESQLVQLGTLYSSTQAVLANLELDKILQSFAEQMTNISDATSTIICRYDAETQTCTVQAAYQRADEPAYESLEALPQTFSLSLPLLDDNAANQASLVLAGAELAAALPGSPLIEQVQAALILPLVSKGRVTGLAVICESRPNARQLKRKAWLCEALANQAAAAIERAALFTNIQQLEQAKSEMIRMASHDLRGPVTRIKGFADLLEDRIGAQVPPEQRDYFDLIREGVSEIEQIINNILSLERIEARHKTAEYILWTGLIEQVVSALNFELTAKQLTLHRDYAEDLPTIRGDAAQLRRAVANLLSNAIKYTPEGGAITVRALLRSYGGRPHVVLEVQDTGVGIPTEWQANLFQPFYRAGRTINDSVPGTGLGLTVVKAVVEYHNGNVFFWSEPGRGSLFGFRIPI